MVCGLIAGTTYPFRTLKIFWRSPSLLRFLIIPISINILVGILLYTSLLFPAWNGFDALTLSIDMRVDRLIADLPAWLGFLDNVIIGFTYLLRFLLLVGLFLVTGFFLLQFGTLLGAPWYGKLSEEMEKFRLGEAKTIEVGLIRDLGRAILFEIKKLVLWLVIAIPLLLLNIIPWVGSFAIALLWIALTAAIAGLDFLDGPSERRRLKFRQKLGILIQTFPASASFSLVCCGLISIPFVNLFTVPLCVASGTLFWCDRVLPKLEH
ncbi:EI24 domain-containing protein [Spirulina sp. 06S082]|uniref:EI24 domain-containing protein n=1 Tax=Spirulina sp. 06S082 TaxID=3110248 RepID=UPI002B200D8F|nr:EI24 domain-containing protein [Spirulina sp. 06S082]MEA5469797.1 EI24 domain-containing protein [Spirulina sp. 06S082]